MTGTTQPPDMRDHPGIPFNVQLSGRAGGLLPPTRFSQPIHGGGDDAIPDSANDNASMQTSNALAETRDQLSKTQNELIETQKLIEAQALVIQLLMQPKEVPQSVIQMESVSSNHLEQGSLVRGAERNQGLKRLLSTSADTEEMIRSSVIHRTASNPSSLDESSSADTNNPPSAAPQTSNPSALCERNGTQRTTDADAVNMGVHCEDVVSGPTATGAPRVSSNQSASSSTNGTRAGRQSNRSGARRRTSSHTLTAGSTQTNTEPIGVRLPDGYYAIDLGQLVESQTRLGTDRYINISGAGGHPYVLELNQTQLPARGSMCMALACRSKHGYYSCLFQLADENKQDEDVITRPFQRDGTNRQKIEIPKLTMIKQLDRTFHKAGTKICKGKATFSLVPFPLGNPNEKNEEPVGTNKEVSENYHLKEPLLIVWFTDESGRVYQPSSDVNGPAIEPSVDRSMNTSNPVPSFIGVSFVSSNRHQITFPLQLLHISTELLSSGRILLELSLISNGQPSALYFFPMDDGSKINPFCIRIEEQCSTVSVVIGKHTSSEIRSDPALQHLLSIPNHGRNGLGVVPPIADDMIRSLLSASGHNRFSVHYRLLQAMGDLKSPPASYFELNPRQSLGDYVEMDEPSTSVQVGSATNGQQTANYEEKHRTAKRPIHAVSSEDRLSSKRVPPLQDIFDELFA